MLAAVGAVEREYSPVLIIYGCDSGNRFMCSDVVGVVVVAIYAGGENGVD